MLITDAIPTPTFSHHETFHLRYGWLKRAYDQVQNDGQIFTRADATVKLGVGKNMVRAIKFWSIASKILRVEGPIKNASVVPTDMGKMMFSDDGFDPYLEKPDTLWLLHWLLFAPPCRIPVWWIIMNEFPATNISIENVTESIITRVTNISEWSTPSPKSIKKDVGVFIHTYTTRQDKLSIEHYLDCPFRQLHMIKQSSRDNMRFVFGKKHGLSPLITAFTCLDFIDRAGIKSNSIPISRLATETGSVGNIFKINENDLANLLEDACNESESIKLRNTNGAQHLIFDSAKNASLDMLCLIYGKKIIAPKKYNPVEITP